MQTGNAALAVGRSLHADQVVAQNDSGASESDTDIRARITCTGGVIAARTCYFKDLLWDTERQRFAFFGPSHTQPHMMSDLLLTSDELDPAEPWIKLRRRAIDIQCLLNAANLPVHPGMREPL